jgi:hypothetical protein
VICIGVGSFPPSSASSPGKRFVLRNVPPLDAFFIGLPTTKAAGGCSRVSSVAVQKSASFLPRTRHADF